MRNALQIFTVLCFFFMTITISHGQVIATPNQLLNECLSNNALTISRNTTKLQSFPKSEFDSEARQNLTKLLLGNPPHQDKLIQLAGFLEIKGILMDKLSQEEITKKDKQSIKLALVRTGDEAKLKNLMKNVKKIPIGDEFVFEVLPILIYVRQKKVTDYLLEIIMSDEKKCTPADAETPGNINCAYRIIEAVAPVINDFPYEVDDFGDLITKDYSKVLSKTRKWIGKNKTSYTLNTDIY